MTNTKAKERAKLAIRTIVQAAKELAEAEAAYFAAGRKRGNSAKGKGEER